MLFPVQAAAARFVGPGPGQANAVECESSITQLADGRIYLLPIYAKSAKDNVPPNVLLKIKETLHAHD